MSDPKTRALSLIDELDSDRPALARALRLAIAQIPTTSWRPMETAPDSTWVRLLVVDESGCRSVQDCSHDAQGWWIAGEGYLLTATPLAWRPADSTELPEDWGQLETMPHLFPNEARQAGEHKASHAWVPIAECGELTDGDRYIVELNGEPDGQLETVYRDNNSEWRGRGNGPLVIAVLSPHLGPIPEPPPPHPPHP